MVEKQGIPARFPDWELVLLTRATTPLGAKVVPVMVSTMAWGV
jgi:hypothetical protein